MRNGRIATALVCGCLFALPAFAADPGKDVDGDNLPAGQFTGQLVSTPGTDGSFTLKVEMDRIELRPGAGQSENRDVQQLARDQRRIEQTQAEMARARNPSDYRRLVRQLAGEMDRMQTQAVKLQLREGGDYTIKKETKEIDFHTADGVKVRTMNLPVEYDDKGNPKQYTKEELKTLKGKDSDLPGYESTLDSLKVGDTVKVTLAAPKADKDADPKTDADAKKSNAVTMIVITAEATGDASKGKKK